MKDKQKPIDSLDISFRLPNGKETTVNVKKLAPRGNTQVPSKEIDNVLDDENCEEKLDNIDKTAEIIPVGNSLLDSDLVTENNLEKNEISQEQNKRVVVDPQRRESIRVRRKPERLDL